MEDTVKNEIKRTNTYSHYAKWRITAILLCLAFALIFYNYNSNILYSSYDSFMVREIFFRDHQLAARAQSSDLGAFWKWMGAYIACTFVAGSIVLVVNTIAVNKNRRRGAICDIITYAVLALTIPVYFAVSMLASRSFYISSLSFTFGINAGAFIGLAIMFFSHLRLYYANKDLFEDGKGDLAGKIISIAALFIPVVFMCSALVLAAGYSHNYGTFKGHPLETDVNIENMLYNYYNGAVEYDGCLYFDSSEGTRNITHSIYRVDGDGNLTHLIDIERDISHPAKLRFDVYGDDIYYISLENESDELIRYNIMKANITTGSTSVLLSDTFENEQFMASVRTYIDMFKIVEGKLYFHLPDDRSIYYLDLEGDPTEKLLFVSDIFFTEDTFDSLTYRFLYGYYDSLMTFTGKPAFNHGDYHFYTGGHYVDEDGDRVYHWFIRRTDSSRDYETIFDSTHIDGVCLYDGTMYIFNFDTGELFALDVESGECHVHTTIPKEDDYYYIPVNGLWAYGDNLIISIAKEPFVIAR